MSAFTSALAMSLDGDSGRSSTRPGDPPAGRVVSTDVASPARRSTNERLEERQDLVDDGIEGTVSDNSATQFVGRRPMAVDSCGEPISKSTRVPGGDEHVGVIGGV